MNVSKGALFANGEGVPLGLYSSVMLRSSEERQQDTARKEVIFEPTLNEIFLSEQNAVYYIQ